MSIMKHSPMSKRHSQSMKTSRFFWSRSVQSSLPTALLFALLEIVIHVDGRHLADQLIHQTLALTFSAEDILWIDRIAMRIKPQDLAIAGGGKREGFHLLDELHTIPAPFELYEPFHQ